MRAWGVVALLATMLFAAGCGDESTDSANRTDSPTTAARTDLPPEPKPDVALAKDPANVAAAVRAVREDLPDIPLYEGATFKGAAVSDTEVCVSRTLTDQHADTLGGLRTSHVVVTVPDMTIGEHLDGPCGTPPPDAAAKVQRFFLAMDDLAIQLDEAIGLAQNGDASTVGRIEGLRKRIEKRNYAWLLSGADTSVGANLLQSAATTARDAARRGDQARLADQRREVAAARAKLASELVK